uniref:Uncharacterized protein n=1 Tax=Anopheles atroparvus TaxID=41427 RepID=A0A182J810_ANOAO
MDAFKAVRREQHRQIVLQPLLLVLDQLVEVVDTQAGVVRARQHICERLYVAKAEIDALAGKRMHPVLVWPSPSGNAARELGTSASTTGADSSRCPVVVLISMCTLFMTSSTIVLRGTGGIDGTNERTRVELEQLLRLGHAGRPHQRAHFVVEWKQRDRTGRQEALPGGHVVGSPRGGQAERRHHAHLIVGQREIVHTHLPTHQRVIAIGTNL